MTAKDDKGVLSTPAVVTITVKPVNQPPVANATVSSDNNNANQTGSSQFINQDK